MKQLYMIWPLGDLDRFFFLPEAHCFWTIWFFPRIEGKSNPKNLQWMSKMKLPFGITQGSRFLPIYQNIFRRIWHLQHSGTVDGRFINRSWQEQWSARSEITALPSVVLACAINYGQWPVMLRQQIVPLTLWPMWICGHQAGGTNLCKGPCFLSISLQEEFGKERWTDHKDMEGAWQCLKKEVEKCYSLENRANPNGHFWKGIACIIRVSLTYCLLCPGECSSWV